jgi:hypothetical protein
MSKVMGYLVSDFMGDIIFRQIGICKRDPHNRHFVEESALGTAEIHLVS